MKEKGKIATLADVIACYRLLLGREPDAAGLQYHFQNSVLHQVDPERLARSFMESEEYRLRRATTADVTPPRDPAGSFALSIHGVLFHVPLGDRIYSEGGDYEPYVFHPLMERLGPGTTFVDVGANIGVFSIHAARRGARVLAFEPNARNAAHLLANAHAADVPVELHPLGLSDRRGHGILQVDPRSSNGFLRADEVEPRPDDVVVPLATLYEMVWIRRVDVVKIDIEGHEYRAIRGGIQMLRRWRPAVFTEYCPAFQKDRSGVEGRDYLRIFLEMGYSVHLLSRRAPAMVFPMSDVLDRIQSAWEEEVERGGTHLDLQLDGAP